MGKPKKQIKIYKDIKGHEPFAEWINKLAMPVRARVFAKLDRVETDNLGDHKYISDGISEFRLQFGPGYRIYYGETENTVIILLCGGTKATQKKDITKAKKFWGEFKNRSKQ